MKNQIRLIGEKITDSIYNNCNTCKHYKKVSSNETFCGEIENGKRYGTGFHTTCDAFCKKDKSND